MADTLVNWAVLIFLGAAYHLFIGQHVRRRRRRGWFKGRADLDHRQIRRRPILGGLINEYERAA